MVMNDVSKESSSYPAVGPCGKMEYSYDDPEDLAVPASHLNILSAYLLGVTDKDVIAERVGATRETVRRVLHHGPNKRWLRSHFDHLWQSRFAGIKEIEDGFRGAAKALVDKAKSGNVQALNAYFKLVGGNLLPGGMETGGGGVMDDDDIGDVQKALDTTATPAEGEDDPDAPQDPAESEI